MPDIPNILPVTNAEQGMKLISFLSRRFDGLIVRAELHRWIRSGQVRVNGGRAKAFDRLEAGDEIRIPPFAAGRTRSGIAEEPSVAPGDDLGHGLTVLAVQADILAMLKPAHLPSQPGTGHDANAVDCLARYFVNSAYIPAPAHRLDKDTTGILLAGLTHAAQEELHALFAAKADDSSGMEKTYLVWVGGLWPHDGEEVLADRLGKDTKGGGSYETVRVARGTDTNEEHFKFARSRVTPITCLRKATLLRVVLETGRTHQIRVQLASRGFPVIGDGKYRGRSFPRMLLHAWKLAFSWRGERLVLSSLPDWPAPFTVPGDMARDDGA